MPLEISLPDHLGYGPFQYRVSLAIDDPAKVGSLPDEIFRGH